MKERYRMLRFSAGLFALLLLLAFSGCQSRIQPSGTEDGSGGEAFQQALEYAKDVVRSKSISKESLIWEVQSKLGIDHMDAVHAVENCGADWKEEALDYAKELLEKYDSGWNPGDLESHLQKAKFLEEERVYAVENCGIDWKEETKKYAEYSLSALPRSKDQLTRDLKERGFQEDYVDWAVDSLHTDWKEQAVLALKRYFDPFGEDLYDQGDWNRHLVSLGFTDQEISYAVKRYYVIRHDVIKVAKTSQTVNEYGILLGTSEYDERGNKIRTVDSAGSIRAYSYDDHDRLIESVYGTDIEKYEYRETISYNEHGDISASGEEYTGGEFIEKVYAYDYENGRIRSSERTTLVDGKKDMVEEKEYTYDEKGNAVRIVVTDRLLSQNREVKYLITHEYTYENDRILKDICIQYTGSDEKESSIQVGTLTEYDTEGRMVFFRETHGTQVGATSETHYSYNEYGLLEEEIGFPGNVLKHTYTYW